jgi:hypothetical protein
LKFKSEQREGNPPTFRVFDAKIRKWKQKIKQTNKKVQEEAQGHKLDTKKGVQRYGFKIIQKVMKMTLKRNKGY